MTRIAYHLYLSLAVMFTHFIKGNAPSPRQRIWQRLDTQKSTNELFWLLVCFFLSLTSCSPLWRVLSPILTPEMKSLMLPMQSCL